MNFIEKYSVPNFDQIKLKLITLINQVPKNSLESEGQKISHTDYSFSKQDPFHYRQFFIDNVLKEYSIYFGKKYERYKIEIDSLWFQVYKKGDYHTWHSHAKTNFKNCEDVSVKEGDILTFPAHMLHRSPVNNNEKEKIIISWNSNFIDG